jgi:hypothetical protein
MNKGKLVKLSFLQALAVFVYCGLVALIFDQGSYWFGTQANFLAPFLLLILFFGVGVNLWFNCFFPAVYSFSPKRNQTSVKIGYLHCFLAVCFFIAFDNIFILQPVMFYWAKKINLIAAAMTTKYIMIRIYL